MRKLFCIYDIHLGTDVESKRLDISIDDIESIRKKAHGKENIKKIESIINDFYDSLENRLKDEKIDKIYQDGGAIDWATVAETKPDIYRQFLNDLEEKAAAGSRSYKLVLDFEKKGAEIKQTEDPKMLLEEVALLQNYSKLLKIQEELHNGKKYSQEEEREVKELAVKFSKQQSEITEIRRKRDLAIADNINNSLKEAEVGLLIIGAMHNIKSYLAEDIELEEIMPAGLERSF